MLSSVRFAFQQPSTAIITSQRVFNFVNGSDSVQVRPDEFAQALLLQFQLPSEMVSDDVRVLDVQLDGLDSPDYATWLEFDKFEEVNSSKNSGQWLFDSLSVRIKPKFVHHTLEHMFKHWLLTHLPWQRAREPLVAVVAFARPQQQVDRRPELRVHYDLDGETFYFILENHYSKRFGAQNFTDLILLRQINLN